MPDLVPEVAEQGPVRLVHLNPQLFAMDVVALGQIQCDDPVVVTGRHGLVRAGQQAKSQAVIGIPITPDDRQLQLIQLDDQPPLGRLGPGERRESVGVVIVGPFQSQRARCAESAGIVDRNQPIAFGEIAIGTQFVIAGADEAGFVAFVARGDHQQGHVVERKPQRAATRQTGGVLECQTLAAVGAVEVTHPAHRLRKAPRQRRHRSRWSPHWCR